MASLAAIIGRICIAALFVVAGIGKLMDPAGTVQYLAMAGLPAGLALPVGIFEVVAGLLLALGFMTRPTALALIGFTAAATLVFHSQISDPMQSVMALKNIAIMGGLMMVFAYGQVSWRIGTFKERDRRHEAEIAAARADVRADALEQDRTGARDGVPVIERRGPFSGRRRIVTDPISGDPIT